MSESEIKVGMRVCARRRQTLDKPESWLYLGTLDKIYPSGNAAIHLDTGGWAVVPMADVELYHGLAGQ